VLRLKELDSPVRIVPGTKNLTLTRRLDKEVSVQGAAFLSKKTFIILSDKVHWISSLIRHIL
jgi:hypothetical protein